MIALGQIRRYHRALWGTLLALLIAGLLSLHLATAVSADVSVNIMNFAFSPTPLTVPVGTKVVWTNQQAQVPHTVTSDSGMFDSGTLQTGASFSFTFTQAGTFAYHCTIHPNMHGMVVVTAAGAPVTAPSAPVTAPSAPVTAPPVPVSAPVVAAPPAAPRTGGGSEADFIKRLGDG